MSADNSSAKTASSKPSSVSKPQYSQRFLPNSQQLLLTFNLHHVPPKFIDLQIFEDNFILSTEKATKKYFVAEKFMKGLKIYTEKIDQKFESGILRLFCKIQESTILENLAVFYPEETKKLVQEKEKMKKIQEKKEKKMKKTEKLEKTEKNSENEVLLKLAEKIGKKSVEKMNKKISEAKVRDEILVEKSLRAAQRKENKKSQKHAFREAAEEIVNARMKKE